MGAQIHVKPEDAWDYFSHAKDILAETQVEIARNEETDTSVCITIDNGFPLFNVYRRGGKLYSEPAVREDCFGTLRDIYIKYLFPIIVGRSEDNKNDKPKEEPAMGNSETNYVSERGAIKRAVGSSGPQDIIDKQKNLEFEKSDIDVYITDTADFAKEIKDNVVSRTYSYTKATMIILLIPL